MNGETQDTLLSRAVSNYNAAVTLRNNMAADEMYLNIIGYHLQQAVELAMKYQLTEEGIVYPRTHDIDQLIRIANENHADITLTDYISEHSEMLSLWEVKTRYILGYRVEREKIDRAINEINRYLQNVITHENKREAMMESKQWESELTGSEPKDQEQ